jgi:hypothetical protein
MDNEDKKFSQYLVVFVDILGSQNKTDFEEMYHINKIFHEEFEKNQNKDMEHTVYFRKIYTFSDCAYIFYKFKDEISNERKNLSKLFTVALCNCEPIFLRFLKEKIIFRGGISYGDAYVDSHRSMFFGNAVNQAYKLESKIAIHPRIVIDSCAANEVIENIEEVKYKMLATNPEYIPFVGMGIMPPMPETGDGIVEMDLDGEFIFNYLHFPENEMICPDIYLSGQDFIKELIQYCYEQIDKNRQYHIIDKYYYLLRFAQAKLDDLLA